MKKKIKWMIVGLSVVMVVILIYIGALVRYAEREVTTLNNLTASLEVMPEVRLVHSIHRFNGLESYVVAQVELTNYQDAYFFVRDGTVQHYIISTELMVESEILSIASDQVVGGEIQRSQLGIIEETPIFEVQIALDGEVHYVIINAVTGTVIMNFSL